jgi:hypothetical protein
MVIAKEVSDSDLGEDSSQLELSRMDLLSDRILAKTDPRGGRHRRESAGGSFLPNPEHAAGRTFGTTQLRHPVAIPSRIAPSRIAQFC